MHEDFKNRLEYLQQLLGLQYFQSQVEAFKLWEGIDTGEPRNRLCIFHPTGKGKSIVSLTMLALRDQANALVLAPPVTHAAWHTLGKRFGIAVKTISHAGFRQPSFKVHPDMPIIVDEFHLLGGHTGMGWRKFDRIAPQIKAPVIIMSATPNYNDVERVYCVAHALDPLNNRGGYRHWLIQHCETEPNRFGSLPLVRGLKRHPDAAAFLASLPYVAYLRDDAEYAVEEKYFDQPLPPYFRSHNLVTVEDQPRWMASQLEKRMQARRVLTCTEEGYLRPELSEAIAAIEAERQDQKYLIFCTRKTIAEVVARTLGEASTVVMTGAMTTKQKAEALQEFLGDPAKKYLVGTSTMATGTDGIDKQCQTLIILDDTQDDAQRRQLIGRILTRGVSLQPRDPRVYIFKYKEETAL